MDNPEKQGRQEENEQNKNTIQYELDTPTSMQKTKPKQIRYDPSYKTLVSVKIQKHEHPSHSFTFYTNSTRKRHRKMLFSFQHLTSEKQEVQNTSRQPHQLYKVMHSCHILSCTST